MCGGSAAPPWGGDMDGQLAWWLWGLVPVGVLLVVHMAWWGFGVALPGAAFCLAAQRLQDRWLARAAANVVPMGITPAGFVATLFWPAIVSLNLLLLAQVLELFFPGGGRVRLGPFGSYTAFALVAGALFSASQTLFGLVWGESVSRGIRTLFFLLLTGTVVTEAGLTYFRADLLVDTQADPAASVVDRVMADAGPWLAAAVGLIVPVAHTAAGYVAFPQFVLPGLSACVRVVAAALLCVAAALVFLFFGFHGLLVELPPWVAGFRRSASALHARAAALQELARALRGHGRDLKRLEPALSHGHDGATLRDLLQEETREHSETESACGALVERLRAEAEAGDANLVLLSDLAVEVDAERDKLDARATRTLDRCHRLRTDCVSLAEWPERCAAAETHRTEATMLLSQGATERATLLDDCEAAEQEQRKVLDTWTDGEVTGATLGGLEPLVRAVKTGPETSPSGSTERRLAVARFEQSHQIISREMNAAIAAARAAVSEFDHVALETSPIVEQDLPSAGPSPGQLAEVERQITALEVSAMALVKSRGGQLEGLADRIRRRCRELARRPAWWFLLRDAAAWIRRTVSFGRLLP